MNEKLVRVRHIKQTNYILIKFEQLYFNQIHPKAADYVAGLCSGNIRVTMILAYELRLF